MLEQYLLVGCSSVNYRSFCRLATSESLVYASPSVEVKKHNLHRHQIGNCIGKVCRIRQAKGRDGGRKPTRVMHL